jgi:CO dehydrogenase nickel-insertion accessory protein CooC1
MFILLLLSNIVIIVAVYYAGLRHLSSRVGYTFLAVLIVVLFAADSLVYNKVRQQASGVNICGRERISFLFNQIAAKENKDKKNYYNELLNCIGNKKHSIVVKDAYIKFTATGDTITAVGKSQQYDLKDYAKLLVELSGGNQIIIDDFKQTSTGEIIYIEITENHR